MNLGFQIDRAKDRTSEPSDGQAAGDLFAVGKAVNRDYMGWENLSEGEKSVAVAVSPRS